MNMYHVCKYHCTALHPELLLLSIYGAKNPAMLTTYTTNHADKLELELQALFCPILQRKMSFGEHFLWVVDAGPLM